VIRSSASFNQAFSARGFALKIDIFRDKHKSITQCAFSAYLGIFVCCLGAVGANSAAKVIHILFTKFFNKIPKMFLTFSNEVGQSGDFTQLFIYETYSLV